MQDDLDSKIDAVATAESCDKKRAAKKIFETIKEKNITLARMDEVADMTSGEAVDDGSDQQIPDSALNGSAENKRLKKSIKKLTKQNHIINLLKKSEGALIAQKIAEKVTDGSDEPTIERIKRRKTDELSQPDEEQAPITFSANAPKDLNKKQVGISSDEENARSFDNSPDLSLVESIKDK